MPSAISSPANKQLVEQLLASYGQAKSPQDVDTVAFEAFAQLPEAAQYEVLDAIGERLQSKTEEDAFLGNMQAAERTYFAAFAQQQNAEPGQGAADPSQAAVPNGALKGVDLRANEQAIRARAAVSRFDAEMPLMDAADQLLTQHAALRSELLHAELPPELKKKLVASMDAMDMSTLQASAGRLGLAMNRLQSQAQRPRASVPAPTATPAPASPDAMFSRFDLDARSAIGKMASEQLSLSNSANILRLLSSNLSIDALVVMVMLLMFEDNDQAMRQKMREHTEAMERATQLEKKRAAIEDAKTADALDKLAPAAGATGASPATSPPDAAVEERRQQALRAIDDQQKQLQSSMTTIREQLEVLVDRRKQTLEAISKLIATLSQMATTVTNNMR